jgi:hypothetical protein
MAKTAKSFRLDNSDLAELEKLGYAHTSQALEHVMDGYFSLRKITLHELKGEFTEQEVIAMVDRQNGLMLTPDYQVSHAVYTQCLLDFEHYESGLSRRGVDAKALCYKVQQLSVLQLYFWQEEIDRFWNAEKSYQHNLEEFVAKFAISA